ncbi:hypothetical protein D3105_02485 [Streptomyces globisporus]|uniref:Uncharacterized protein n=1 Tax=Streptomyces globisporus TaxID=1908 RepID=A0A423V6C0_STRGL|nr:hypothetical protein D3105_02485 [Streptomyces globisporus]
MGPALGENYEGSTSDGVRHPTRRQQFIEISGGHAARLSREQKSRFVASCWTAQMFKHFEDPKPSIRRRDGSRGRGTGAARAFWGWSGPRPQCVS